MRFLSGRSLSRVLRVALVVFGYAVLARLILAEGLYLVPKAWWAERLAGAPSLHVVLLYLVMLFRIEPGIGLAPQVSAVTAAVRELVQALVLLYIVRILHRISATLVAAAPFRSENSFRIRQVGFAILLLAAVNWLVGILSFVAARVLAPQAANIPALPNLSTVLFGVMVLVLAEVFRHGAELQADQDLTV